MPLHRRLPKRGFTNIFRTEYAELNVHRFNELEGSEFSPESLVASGVIKNLRDGLKILGTGELTRAVNVTAHAFTKQAAAKIPESERPSVVYLGTHGTLLQTPGMDTVFGSIIELAGGRNVTTDLTGQAHSETIPVTIEQIAKWDPDVIIAETTSDHGPASPREFTQRSR